MKQLKFLMVALTLLMGVSFTSCLGDSDPTVTSANFGRIIESFPRMVIETPGGLKFTALNTTDISLYSGDYVYFQYSYDSEQQKVDQNTKNIDANITILEKLAHNYCEFSDDKGENYENATIIRMGEGGDNGMGYNKVQFFYYDENRVILPLVFLMEEASKESLDKHSFSLVYDENETAASDTDIVFYLRHNSMETKAKKTVYSNKLFDITTALRQFVAKTGKKPTNVVIYTNETRDTTTDDLKEKKDELTKYSLGYSEWFKD